MKLFWVKYHQLFLGKYQHFQLSPESGESNAVAVSAAEAKDVQCDSGKPSKRQKKNQKKVRSSRTESGNSEEETKADARCISGTASVHEMNKNCEAVLDDMGDTVSPAGEPCDEVVKQENSADETTHGSVEFTHVEAEDQRAVDEAPYEKAVETKPNLPDHPREARNDERGGDVVPPLLPDHNRSASPDNGVASDSASECPNSSDSETVFRNAMHNESDECPTSSDSEAVLRNAIPKHANSRQALLKESMNISKKLREIAKIESIMETRKLDKLQVAKIQKKASLQRQLDAVQGALVELDNVADADPGTPETLEAMHEDFLACVDVQHHHVSFPKARPPGTFIGQLPPGIPPPPGLPPPTALPTEVAEEIPDDMQILLNSISSELNRVAKNFTGETGSILEQELPKTQPCKVPAPVANPPAAQKLHTVLPPNPQVNAAMWANSAAMYDTFAREIWAAHYHQQQMWLNCAAAMTPGKALLMVE